MSSNYRSSTILRFPDYESAKKQADKKQTPRFPKVVPDKAGGQASEWVVRRDTYSGRACSSTYLCVDGRFRASNNIQW